MTKVYKAVYPSQCKVAFIFTQSTDATRGWQGKKTGGELSSSC